MQARIALLAAALFLLAAGCIPSLHPLYTAEDTAFEPKLVGTWLDEDENETWAFSQDGDHAYLLEYTDNRGRPGRFKVHMVELGGHRFLDLCPVKPDSGVNEFYQLHLLPMHTFAHVRRVEPELELGFADPEKVKKLLQVDPAALAHDTAEDGLLLTATTDDLRLFLPAHVDSASVFGEYGMLRRVP